ncbi:DNA repair protein RecO [Anaerocolumna xylanovorans]|uniref:DNA repair protein RecO n=1 Tax=Anaerocolumna xylanovorans DSM 12503 TaxID=1121345 RepID=A0A1M7Y5P8_9FIRM|nr:DNA repair protein RecO [Anaerocolumna xylanovorans]SHO47791.1 DNA replication and repair protein RecO [Anaerocolumna xylanovorans DSM 12503]
MTASAVTGMVLSAMPVGEYDKRLVILTKEKGKITAFAKGARKPGSAFLACSNPFSFGTFELFEGRNSYTVLSVNITNYFEELRINVEAAYFGMYFCELADYYGHEFEDGGESLKLLYQSLKALTLENIGKTLVRRIYELRLFQINGVAPQVFACVKCGRKENLSSFSGNLSGVLCQTCHTDDKYSTKISDAALYTMQYILSASLTKLYTFTVSEEVLKELEDCVDNHAKRQIDRELKSLKILKMILLP